MIKHLLSTNKNAYKANLHCHTTVSDGRKTPEEVKELYMKLGYSIVAFTDHDVFIPHNDLTDDNFLALNGYEMEINEDKDEDYPYIKTCHMCFIALEPDNFIQCCWHRNKYLLGNARNYRETVKFDKALPDFEREYNGECISDMMHKGRDGGFFVTYNHPTWSKETYREYMTYSGMHAIEMFNGSCNCSGFDEYNPRVYDDILSSGKRIYCIGADDNHNSCPDGSRRSDSGWAYTVIFAESLDYRTVTEALEAGDFYASEGPEIYSLTYEDGKVHIRCSDADRINCNFCSRHIGTALSEGDGTVNEAEFTIPEKCGYFRITIIDKSGKRACTNAYFVDEQ